MSEYLCSGLWRGRSFTYEGCNDCKGLRKVHKGKPPKDAPKYPCTCTPRWVGFTKRTDDPKLGWIERRLTERGIPSRRNGRSFHANACLEVPEAHADAAWALLSERIGRRRKTVDDMEDDDPVFFADISPEFARLVVEAERDA